jgi:hypothetical protein
METFKLEIELVPQDAWYKSLAQVLDKDSWITIAKETSKKADYVCEVCGDRGYKHWGDNGVRLEAHERWEYDDERHLQKLKGTICLCEKCHRVKHLGKVGVDIEEGRLDPKYMDILVDHFCKVNGCQKDDFEKHREEVFRRWEDRSKYPWSTDYGSYSEIVEKHHK